MTDANRENQQASLNQPPDAPLRFVISHGVPCMENERVGRPATVMECAAEIERLRAALERIVKRPGLQYLNFSCDAQVMVDWAREALDRPAVETKDG